MVVDSTLKDWQAQIETALAAGTSLCIRGAGSKDFLGERSYLFLSYWSFCKILNFNFFNLFFNNDSCI